MLLSILTTLGKKCFEHVKRSFIKMKSGENFTSSFKTKHFGSGCTISPEELVETDSEENDSEEDSKEEVNLSREMATGSSNTIQPSLLNATNKRKLEDEDLIRKERELLILAQRHADIEMERIKMKLENIKNQRELLLARSNAGQDQKRSKKGPPQPGPSNQGPGYYTQ